MSHFAISDIFFAAAVLCAAGAMAALAWHVARCWDEAKHASARLHERHHNNGKGGR